MATVYLDMVMVVRHSDAMTTTGQTVRQAILERMAQLLALPTYTDIGSEMEQLAATLQIIVAVAA